MYLQFNVVVTLAALVSSRCCVSLAVVLPWLLPGAVRVVFHTLLGGDACVDRLRRTGSCLAFALLLSVLSFSWWRVACGSWRIAIASSALWVACFLSSVCRQRLSCVVRGVPVSGPRSRPAGEGGRCWPDEWFTSVWNKHVPTQVPHVHSVPPTHGLPHARRRSVRGANSSR